jgi:hypothetical protein
MFLLCVYRIVRGFALISHVFLGKFGIDNRALFLSKGDTFR